MHTLFYKAVKGILILTSLISGCAIMPNRNVLSLNKTIELDERAIEKMNVGIRLEWIK